MKRYPFLYTAVLYILPVSAFLLPAPAHSAGLPENMVLVKGGCFQMGDVLAHEVCIDDLYLSKYELTAGEFRSFVEKTGYRTEAERQDGCHSWSGSKEKKRKDFSWRNTNFPQTDRDPVICVSWNDAQEYIKWLNKITGKDYRLPTEAEWEYAARSRGKAYIYSWGNGGPSGNIADDKAKELIGKTGEHSYNDGYAFTSPAGSFKPNELGIFDMSGNVSEWTADWFDKDYYEHSPKDNPTGPASGECKVIRGASWNPLLPLFTITKRLCSVPGARGSWLGFRLAHPGQ